jgi:hypothetical protein
MTAIWSIEIISFFAGETIIFYLLSIINCLQGVIIFYMLVCRDNEQKEPTPLFDVFSMRTESEQRDSKL